MEGYAKLALHVVGLAFVIAQEAKLYEFDDPSQSTFFVQGYSITQLFVFGAIMAIRRAVDNAAEYGEQPLVYTVHKTKIATTFAKYDKQEADSMLSTSRIIFVVVTVASFQFKLISMFSLFVFGFLRTVSMVTNPLFRIYCLGAADVGDLERPWGPDETVWKEDSDAAKAGSEDTAPQESKKVDSKKAGKKTKKNE
ncbi:hypothetical protein BJ741DRAFT_600383 [Chytriomyces cf. hyalinus JEL632]|nr:hypothetical protein BJ741DRAFT_600383 [Chytriomyces cf. hyalinus JEL632]